MSDSGDLLFAVVFGGLITAGKAGVYLFLWKVTRDRVRDETRERSVFDLYAFAVGAGAVLGLFASAGFLSFGFSPMDEIDLEIAREGDRQAGVFGRHMLAGIVVASMAVSHYRRK
jgi:hypothetical protein